ncbi:hypothetical protein D3C81_1676930 [compost metagenome]
MQRLNIAELGQPADGREGIVEEMGVDLRLQRFQLRFFFLEAYGIIAVNKLFDVAAHPVEGCSYLSQLVIALIADPLLKITVPEIIQRAHNLLNPPRKITRHPDPESSQYNRADQTDKQGHPAHLIRTFIEQTVRNIGLQLPAQSVQRLAQQEPV